MIGLFPEGTRSPDGQMHEAKGGIGFLIAKGDVPVVPLYITGTFQAFPKGSSQFRPSRVTARIGQPIIARGNPRRHARKRRLRRRRHTHHAAHPRTGGRPQGLKYFRMYCSRAR